MGNLLKGSKGNNSRSKGKNCIVVKVKTGDKRGAGTDANIKIAFISDKGDVSKQYPLDVLWRNDFEAGSLDDFKLKNLPDMGHVHAVEIWRNEAGVFSDWYVEWISVVASKSGDHSIFPIHRWIPPNKLIRIYEFDSTLPQKATDTNSRKEELDAKRKAYAIKVKIDGWLPQIKELPSDESFSMAHQWDMATLLAEIKIHVKIKSLLTGKWKTYQEIFSIYNDTLTKPFGSETWTFDEAFGAQRLNNSNPTVIRRCLEIPDNFAVTEEMLEPSLEGMTMREAINAKCLYYINYKVMEDLPCSGDRIIPAPLALFYVNGQGKLLPVAIQLFQEPARDNPVFLPTDDKNTWLLAKMFFNTADASFHQSCTHLGYTHLIMEPIAVAVHRLISPSHPMFRLLAPHLEYVMAVNTQGLPKLMSPGGWFDRCTTIGSTGVSNLIVRQLANWRLDIQGVLPRDLEDRGVDDIEALPNYHYRDDALLIFKAIESYVTTIVNHSYQTPEDIEQDHELLTWGETLAKPVSEGGTGVPGVIAGGIFKTTKDVVEIMTAIIYMATVAHAASNYGQYDDYGFPPNYPLFLQGDVIKDKKPKTEEDIHKTLPTKEATIDIMVIARLLSTRAPTSLGDYKIQYLFDPASVGALDNFKKELVESGQVIDERNKTRTVPYTYLHPDCIPNTISI